MDHGKSGWDGFGDEQGRVEDGGSPAPNSARDSSPIKQDREGSGLPAEDGPASEPHGRGAPLDEGSVADGREPPESSGGGEEAKRRPARATTRRRIHALPRGPRIFEAHCVCNFLSTSRTPRLLGTVVERCLGDNTRLDHILIHGDPGSGTALLARALLNDFAPRRIVDIDAALGCDTELIRRSIDEAGPRGVLFIRHIDALDAECENLLAGALGAGASRFTRRSGSGPADPSETDLDRAIAASADDRLHGPQQATPDFTLIATAHLMSHVGYMLRTRFQHLFHLRDDPKALRNAVLRALRRHGPIALDTDCLPQLERVLGTLTDSAESVVEAVLLRAESEGNPFLDRETMRSVLEEDLASRTSDEAYSASLRRHLAGRKIDCVTPDEVRRIAEETGWGTVAAQAALSIIAREDARRRNP
jgi:hypothetical protein